MKNQTFLFSPFLVALMILGINASAAEPILDLKSHTLMHKNMAKAHEQAAKCLEEGKPHEECRAQFGKACEEAGGPGWCGKGNGHGRGKGRGHRN